MPTTVNPIWKDTYYTASTDSASYEIKLEGNTIYSGKAVRCPDASALEININKVCRNYLSCDIDEILSSHGIIASQTNNLAERTFKLYVNGSNVQDYRFYMDWSYDMDAPTQQLSQPINGHYVPGMLKLQTVRTSNYITYANGTGYDKQVACAPYVLYYLNSYGGWDAFVIEGETKKKDAFTTYQTDQAFHNTTIEFETNKYVQEIKTSYELNTGYLTDEQSANLAKNLVGSLKVYLHDVPNDIIKPVIITDANVTYQTYKQNGRKLSQYKINITESQSKIRK